MTPEQAVKAILDEYEAGKHKPHTIQHTPECKADQAKYEEAVALYVARWPNYCRKCDGRGGTYYQYDPSPAGISLSPGYMTDFDPCPDCMEHGKCPRCGNIVWTDDDFDGDPVTCHVCGWNEESPDAAPEPPECECWDIERREFEFNCQDDVEF